MDTFEEEVPALLSVFLYNVMLGSGLGFFLFQLIVPKGVRRRFFHSERRQYSHSNWWHLREGLEPSERTPLFYKNKKPPDTVITNCKSTDASLISPLESIQNSKGYQTAFRSTRSIADSSKKSNKGGSKVSSNNSTSRLSLFSSSPSTSSPSSPSSPKSKAGGEGSDSDSTVVTTFSASFILPPPTIYENAEEENEEEEINFLDDTEQGLPLNYDFSRSRIGGDYDDDDNDDDGNEQRSLFVKTPISRASNSSSRSSVFSSLVALPLLSSSKKKEKKRQLLVLISRGVSFRDQAFHQDQALHILNTRNVNYILVDGNDSSQAKRREELFQISGIRGHYPQIFIMTCSQEDEGNGSCSVTQYIGNHEALQILNDDGKLNPKLLTSEVWDNVAQLLKKNETSFFSI